MLELTSTLTLRRTRALAVSLVCASSLLACGGGDPMSSSSETNGETGETGSETGDGELVQDVEVVLYETQPMVVDLIVRLAPGAEGTSFEWTHAFDAGVRFAELEGVGNELERHVRVRGLHPAMLHGVDLAASLGESGETVPVEFTTLGALPGWFPQMEIEVTGDPEPVYRLMDWSNFGGPTAPPVGIVQFDVEGKTRWYLGRQDTMMGVGATMAGVKLLPDGALLFQHNGMNEIVDELGVTRAIYKPEDVGDNTYHHEVLNLPNGNILSLDFEFDWVDYPDPEGSLFVAGDRISEVTPEGEKVWEWSSLAHLDPQRRREGFNDALPPIIDPVTGMAGKDWTHGNGMFYDPSDDSIIVSLRHQDWLVKIDHETGDVIWRLGEEGDFTLESGDWFYHQHSPEVQADGSILLYDNGNANPNLAEEFWFSRAMQISLDETNMTARIEWEDDAEDFLSEAMGDADRMPGGHILVLDSALDLNISPTMIHSRVREVDPEAPVGSQTVWSMTTAVGRFIYRALPTTRLVGEAE